MRRGTAGVAVGAAMVVLFSATGCRWDVLEKGAKFGLNFAKLDDDGTKTDSRFGIAGGHFMTYDVKENIAYQSEIVFNMKGGKETVLRGGGPNERWVDITTKVSYVEYHGLAKFMMPVRGEVKPIGLAGATFGLNVGDDRVDDDPNVGVTTTDMGANFFEIGLLIGAGAEFETSGKKLRVDLRFGIGLTEVVDTSLEENRVTTLMVGFVF